MISINDTTSPFFYTRMPEETHNEIKQITSYTEEKEKNGIKVIIIDEYSSLYMISLKQSNGEFDCFNNGNLGRDGGKGAIEEIKKMKNTEILIPQNDNEVFWQEPKEVREYIINNLKYEGKIGRFSIYATQMEGE